MASVIYKRHQRFGNGARMDLDTLRGSVNEAYLACCEVNGIAQPQWGEERSSYTQNDLRALERIEKDLVGLMMDLERLRARVVAREDRLNRQQPRPEEITFPF